MEILVFLCSLSVAGAFPSFPASQCWVTGFVSSRESRCHQGQQEHCGFMPVGQGFIAVWGSFLISLAGLVATEDISYGRPTATVVGSQLTQEDWQRQCWTHRGGSGPLAWDRRCVLPGWTQNLSILVSQSNGKCYAQREKEVQRKHSIKTCKFTTKISYKENLKCRPLLQTQQ